MQDAAGNRSSPDVNTERRGSPQDYQGRVHIPRTKSGGRARVGAADDAKFARLASKRSAEQGGLNPSMKVCPCGGEVEEGRRREGGSKEGGAVEMIGERKAGSKQGRVAGRKGGRMECRKKGQFRKGRGRASVEGCVTSFLCVPHFPSHCSRTSSPVNRLPRPADGLSYWLQTSPPLSADSPAVVLHVAGPVCGLAYCCYELCQPSCYITSTEILTASHVDQG